MKVIEVKESVWVEDRVFPSKEEAKEHLRTEARIGANHKVSALVNKNGRPPCMYDLYDVLYQRDEISYELQAIRNEYLLELKRIDQL